jgi:hypothetical protein
MLVIPGGAFDAVGVPNSLPVLTFWAIDAVVHTRLGMSAAAVAPRLAQAAARVPEVMTVFE